VVAQGAHNPSSLLPEAAKVAEAAREAEAPKEAEGAGLSNSRHI